MVISKVEGGGGVEKEMYTYCPYSMCIPVYIVWSAPKCEQFRVSTKEKNIFDM